MRAKFLFCNLLIVNKVKMYSERLNKAFDMYNRQIDKMITDEDSRIALCEDFEEFEAVCRRYMASREERE